MSHVRSKKEDESVADAISTTELQVVQAVTDAADSCELLQWGTKKFVFLGFSCIKYSVELFIN